MPPATEIEICAEFAVSPRQQVQIKLYGHAFSIIVGALKNIAILLQIDTDEQSAILAANVGDATKEHGRFVRFKIANSVSGKIDDVTCLYVAADRKQDRSK